MRAEGEALDRHVAGGLLDARQDLLARLDARLLRRDQAEHDGLVGGHVAQRREVARARRVVFEQQAIDAQGIKELLGDRVVAALDGPHAAVIAPAEVEPEGHAGEVGDQGVVEGDHLGQPGLGVDAERAQAVAPILAAGVGVARAVELDVAHPHLDQRGDLPAHDPDEVGHELLARRVGPLRDAGQPEGARLGHRREGRLGPGGVVGVGEQEAHLALEQAVAQGELAAHRREPHILVGGGAAEDDRRGDIGAEAVEAGDDRVPEDAAAELAVGERIQAAFPLEGDGPRDGLFLDAIQLVGRQRPGVGRAHRRLDRLGAQQAADDFGAIGRCAGHDPLPSVGDDPIRR